MKTKEVNPVLHSSPVVGIVIPIYGHSVFASEAILSALNQTADFGIHIVLVNDGCKFFQTHEICSCFAEAYPESITYLIKKNSGLSASRNVGIEFLLNNFSSIEAIYMLDSDNRLRLHSISSAKAALDKNDNVDWIYPNIDMFGIEWGGDYGGDYSVYLHLGMNICEAGSLIHRRVFERGVKFDTDFKLGWEDWDFFLKAAEVGFKGINIEDFGFQYRKRPESMLANSERDQHVLSGLIQSKHKALFSPRSLLKLEHRECPRYAIHVADKGEVFLCTDPDREPEYIISVEKFTEIVWSSFITNGRVYQPFIVFCTTSSTLKSLSLAKQLHFAVWKMEDLLQEKSLCSLKFSFNSADDLSICVHKDGSGHLQNARMIGISFSLFREILKDTSTNWIDTIISPQVQVPNICMEITSPYAAMKRFTRNTASITLDFLAFIRRIHSSSYRDVLSCQWGWREAGIHLRSNAVSVGRRFLSSGPIYPRIPDGRTHVGFIFPIVEFGGVEKVGFRLAEALRKREIIPHLIIIGSDKCIYSDDLSSIFETISFLADPDFELGGHSSKEYLGNEIPRWSLYGSHQRAIGLLCGYDAIINLHGASIVGVMGQLRRLGIMTIQSLHLNDQTLLGRPVGNTYLGLAYEHAIDVFAPCSKLLGGWLNAMGVPQDKICLVPNAPGFALDDFNSEDCLVTKIEQSDAHSIKILYLGRLDRQKGMDRLAQTISHRLLKNIAIEWKIFGKNVVMEDGYSVPIEVASIVRPPISRSKDLASAYAWADIVILLSRFEGLPLTVIEAMRQGVVVIATDVGATSEVISSGINGYLVPNDHTCVFRAAEIIKSLHLDRNTLRANARRAFEDAQARNWESASFELSNRIKKHFISRSATDDKSSNSK